METYAGNASSLISNVKGVNVECVKMSVDRNLILARFEERVSALQALVNATVKRKITSTYAVFWIRELPRVAV